MENKEQPHADELEKVNKIAEHLDSIKDDETLQREAKKFAEWLHGNKIFKKFRHGWDKLPHAVQWAMLKGEETVSGIAPSFFNTLVEMGLLKYKGHGSPEERDEALKEKAEWNKKKTKWGAYIASVFAPEVEALLPFLGPIEKLQTAKATVLESVRHHLDTLQIEKETEGKERKVMNKKDDGEVPYADAA